SSARRAGELQCLGDMPWVSRATAMWPDSCYLASTAGHVNTSDKFAIAAGRALRSVVNDHRIANLIFASLPARILKERPPIVLLRGISRLPVRRFPSKLGKTPSHFKALGDRSSIRHIEE